MQLREMGIIDGNAAEEKQRAIEAKERMFTDDIVDEARVLEIDLSL